MSRVKPLTDAELTEYEDIMAPSKERLGFIPNSQRVMARKPELLKAFNELGKAVDRDAAEAFLTRLAGHTHQVHTAHCLYLPATGERYEETASSQVSCDRPTRAQVQGYLDSEQWHGKAGAYGIQDPAQDFLKLVSGSFDTVVGLHVAAVRRLLKAAKERA